jgi:O-antigen/teichoic acid export membrane protein
MSRNPLRERSSGLATAFQLLSSTMLAQIAVLAATVLSAAWLDPIDFALFGAALGLAGIVNSVNTLGIETRLAIVEVATMTRLLRAGMAAALAITAVGGAAAALLAASGRDEWACVLAFAMAGSVVSALQQVVTTLALRERRPDVLMRSRVAQGAVNAVLILVLSSSPMPGYVALSTAWVVSTVVGLLVSLYGWAPPLPTSWRVSAEDISVTRAQVGLQPVTSLLAGVSSQIPLVVLPLVASASLAGSWALSTRILGAAVLAAFSALQPVYYATAAEYVREHAFPRVATWHRQWAIWLTAATVPGFLVAGLVIAFALPLLGAQWLDARDLVAPACIYWGSQFFGLPLSQTLLLVGRIRLQLLWTVARFVSAVAAFALWPVWGASASIWAWSIVCAATYVVLTVVQARVLQRMAAGESTPTAAQAATMESIPEVAPLLPQADPTDRVS